MKLVLVKQTDDRLEPGTPDADAMRRFLFEMVRGATDKDQRAWQTFIRAINEASRGEYFQIDLKRTRNSRFHRLVFAVMTAVFKAQNSFEDFDVFRQWSRLGAGFAVFVPDEKTGELKAIPKSQSFDECSEEEVRQFFDDVCAFYRSATAAATLWPQAPVETSMLGMEKLLRQFDMEP